MRDRRKDVERHLTDTAAKAAGFTTDLGLSAFADARSRPGGVRADFDPLQETAEELGDARNYLTWGIERIYDRMLQGDSEATAVYERYMRSLSHIVAAWAALVVR